MTLPKEHQRLTELMELLREGEIDDERTRELESILADDPAAVDYYVEAIDVFTTLDRQLGQTPPEEDFEIACAPVVPSESFFANQLRLAPSFYGPAICASLALGLFFGHWFSQRPDSTSIANLKPSVSQQNTVKQVSTTTTVEFATLCQTVDCVWGDSATHERYPGQRLSKDSIDLVSGVATIRFDNDITLALEGPAKLDILAIDRAKLTAGKVVFSGIDDIDTFTLLTPHSTILDEGTVYGVSVDPRTGAEEVHVFDGGVNCLSSNAAYPSGSASVHLVAGEAHRFARSGGSESIEASPAEFTQPDFSVPETTAKPLFVEKFDYQTGPLAQQNGGTGFKNPWQILPTIGWDQKSTVAHGKSIKWPGCSSPLPKNSLLFEGDTNILRDLETPVDLSQDGVFYMSFLLRMQPYYNDEGPGWGYVTLHGKDDHKIAFGLNGSSSPRLGLSTLGNNAAMVIVPEQSYVFVCKIDARAKGEDLTYARIYREGEPVDQVDPVAWNITNPPLTSDEPLGQLRLCCRNSRPMLIGNIRMGRTWQSVTEEYTR